jgi:ribose-phosphate pyrophosphokinase
MNSNNRGGSWTPEVVLGFPESRFHARGLAVALGVTYVDVEIHVFPDGESRVRIADIDAIRSKRAALYRSLDTPNTKIIELILAASVLGAGAAPMLIAPYLPYMRQDKAFSAGEAVSQAVIGVLLAAHFGRFVSFDPHLHRTPDLGMVFAGKPAQTLSAAEAMAAYIGSEFPRGALLIGPDEESGPLVKKVANLAGCDWSAARKQRFDDRHVQVTLPDTVALAHRTIVIIDDVISSGHTIAAVATAAIAAGAGSIKVCATHALYDAAAANVMAAAGVEHIASSDSIPHPSNRFSILDTLASSLKESHDG